MSPVGYAPNTGPIPAYPPTVGIPPAGSVLPQPLGLSTAAGSGASNLAILTSAINAANASTVGGIIYLPAGNGIPISGPLPTINPLLVSIEGAGGLATRFLYQGAANTSMFTIQTSPFSTNQAGHIQGFSVDMTGAGANAVAFHYGDVTGLSFIDIIVTGGIGWWEDNQTNFTERTSWDRCWANQCNVAVRMTVNGGLSSHSYTRMKDFRINLFTGQIGFDIQNGVFCYHPNIMCTGNVNGGAGNTAIVMKLSGNANVLNAQFQMLMEQTTGAGATGLSIPAGTVFEYTGIIDLPGMPPVLGGVYGGFAGFTNVAAPGGVLPAVDLSAATVGKVPFFNVSMTGNTTASSVTGMQAGTVFGMVMIQDAVGGRTFTWPPNFFFTANAPPVLTVTANFRDIIMFYTDGTNCFEVSRALGNP